MARYTIDLDDKLGQTLTDLAESRGSTKAEALRAAVASYNFLKRQLEGNPDLKVSITDKKNNVKKDIELP